MAAGPRLGTVPTPPGDGNRGVSMSLESPDGAHKKAERGRMAVLALMTLYLVLAVAVGVVRNQPHLSGANGSAPVVARAGVPFR